MLSHCLKLIATLFMSSLLSRRARELEFLFTEVEAGLLRSQYNEAMEKCYRAFFRRIAHKPGKKLVSLNCTVYCFFKAVKKASGSVKF